LAKGISEVLTFAVGVAVSPVPIIAVTLMLFSARARVNGLVFLLGWVVALAIVSAIAYALADQGSSATGSTTSQSIAWGRIVFGCLFLLLAWRNFPKPTIAMVEGYCIYAGWMLAAAMDVVFAADNAEFLGGLVEYNSIPWDIGVRRAKELVFESRFIGAEEAARYGLVNRVLPLADLERETYAYARRVAENSPEVLRMAKIQMNKAQDAQGFTNAVEDSLGDYQAMMHMPGSNLRMEGQRRLLAVDLAVKAKRGERFGLKPAAKEKARAR